MDNSATKPIRLVALDIDGTLLAPGVDHRALPDDRITAAVAALKRSGVIVMLASGRMFPGTLHIAEHLNIEEPLICQQGASIHKLDGSLLHRFTIDQDVAREIAEFAVSEALTYAWFDAGRYLVNAHNKASQYFADVSGVPVEHHESPKDSGITTTGVDVISSTDQANGVYQRLKERFGNRVELLDFTSVTAAHSKDANKGKALELMSSALGIAREQVAAVGDSVNDVSMLRWAGLGASPAHCDDYARAVTDRVLTGKGVEGVADFLETLATNAG